MMMLESQQVRNASVQRPKSLSSARCLQFYPSMLAKSVIGQALHYWSEVHVIINRHIMFSTPLNLASRFDDEVMLS